MLRSCPRPSNACRARPPSTPAAVLLALLRRGPQTLTELAHAGLGRLAVLVAVGELVDTGRYRIRLGPLLVEIEADEEVPAA